MLSLQNLEKICAWAQEASREDSNRYYYGTSELENARNGTAYFIIGRKGTGKTALGEHLLALGAGTNPNIYSERLSFRNFPFSELYRLREGASGSPPTASEYISAWRYLIYCSICTMLARNRRLDHTLQARLADAFPKNEQEALSAHIMRWTGGGFNLGQIIGASGSKQVTQSLFSLSQRADALERFIREHIDDGEYYVVLDSLDDDYRYEGELAPGQTRSASKDYFILLAGLFKAVEEIATRFSVQKFRAKILPIVLLRDDIFKFVKDPDRRKWKDITTSIEWDEGKIKALLAHRICRALNEEVVAFPMAWGKLVDEPTFNHFGTRADKFEFITKYTLRRPRDYVFYLRSAAQMAVSRARNQNRQDGHLSGQILRDSAAAFATHLREEIEDELGGQVDDPQKLMDCLLDVGKTLFRESEFGSLYSSRGLHERFGFDHIEALNILFELSAVGFVPARKPVFRYLKRDLKLDSQKTLALHTGLVRAQLVG